MLTRACTHKSEQRNSWADVRLAPDSCAKADAPGGPRGAKSGRAKPGSILLRLAGGPPRRLLDRIGGPPYMRALIVSAMRGAETPRTPSGTSLLLLGHTLQATPHSRRIQSLTRCHRRRKKFAPDASHGDLAREYTHSRRPFAQPHRSSGLP
jgi:hypothetical protein